MKWPYDARNWTDNPVMLVKQKNDGAFLRVFSKEVKWSILVTSVDLSKKGYGAFKGDKLPCVTYGFPSVVISATKSKVYVFTAPVSPVNLFLFYEGRLYPPRWLKSTYESLTKVCRIKSKEYYVPPVSIHEYDDVYEVINSVLTELGFNVGVVFKVSKVVTKPRGWKEAYLSYETEDGKTLETPYKAIVSPWGKPTAIVGREYFLVPNDWLVDVVKDVTGLEAKVLRRDTVLVAKFSRKGEGLYVINSVDGSTPLLLVAYLDLPPEVIVSSATWKHTKQLSRVKTILEDATSQFLSHLPLARERILNLKNVPFKRIDTKKAKVGNRIVSLPSYSSELVTCKNALQAYVSLAKSAPRSVHEKINYFEALNRVFEVV